MKQDAFFAGDNFAGNYFAGDNLAGDTEDEQCLPERLNLFGGIKALRNRCMPACLCAHVCSQVACIIL